MNSRDCHPVERIDAFDAARIRELVLGGAASLFVAPQIRDEVCASVESLHVWANPVDCDNGCLVLIEPQPSHEVWEEALNSVNRGCVSVDDIRGIDGSGCSYDFVLSNGWRVFVFDDCGTWDYVDHLIAPSGIRIEGHPFHSFNPDEARWRWDERPNAF